MRLRRHSLEKNATGTSLAVQWLELHASTAGGIGSIPSWGTKILQAARHSQKKKPKEKKKRLTDCSSLKEIKET